MYCKHCGKEIDDDSVFCPHCGTLLKETGRESTILENAPIDEGIGKRSSYLSHSKPKEQKVYDGKKSAGYSTYPNYGPMNGLGIAGFVVSLACFVIEFFLTAWLWFGCIVGMILSIVAYARRDNYTRGNSLAKAGMIVGIIAVAIGLVFFILILAGSWWW